MPENHSLSVVMPALNEEENIEVAITTTRKVVEKYFSDWEILIFNDGSQDKTGEIAEKLVLKDPTHIKIFHHQTSKNLGGVYKEGIKKASKTYLIMIPGDNENGDEKALGAIFEKAGHADIIIPYITNPEVRPLKRRAISKAFVILTNLVSGCRLHYYNGTVLHKTKKIRQCEIQTNGFGYSAEALVKLIRQGCSYFEVGVELAKRPKGHSKALKWDNIIAVARFLSGILKQSPKDKASLNA